ncbi:hypothetical protein CLIB1444_11S02872 [[Candida] jaroonii]|uniref:Uncharacterized protein n=1 Tax=[Candida] jaroonii TaxID=467808 RepID=A0ACA9YCU1_9ASCO|nr:hypothetical protein CLIB1444_11S02872 [[Candida] jaroonii]
MSINDENHSSTYIPVKRQRGSISLNPISKFQPKNLNTQDTFKSITNPTGFLPIYDTNIDISSHDIVSTPRKHSIDSGDIYYEASPVHYDDIQSLKATKISPSLVEPLKATVEVTLQPKMVPLAPYDFPLDLSKVLGDKIHYTAPFCNTPEPAWEQKGEQTEEDVDESEQSYTMRMLSILQYEIDQENQPKFSFKKFFNWFNQDEYYEYYPWSRFVKHNGNYPLSIENIDKIIPDIHEEFF